MSAMTLVIVGGGPTCTYVTERLAATLPTLQGFQLDIHVFDTSGRFGDGQVHSAVQPATSFLNRIVGQVAFAADESVDGAGALLPRNLRPTLHEWCQRRFTETGDPAYDLSPAGWPKRFMHGMALQDLFQQYLTILREHGDVRVDLHAEHVVDVLDRDGRLEVVSDAGTRVVADRVLMLTGHSTNDPMMSARQRTWTEFAARSASTFVPSAYPLERHITDEVVKPETTVGCVGTGLTAIDIILFLTEGRGGQFVPTEGSRLAYVPSGREPAKIVAFSRAGLFTFARPHNAKEQDLARFEHRGAFLTESSIDALRQSVGVPVTIGGRQARQLDFARHVFPLVVLEMAHLHYATLLGGGLARHLATSVAPVVEAFLAGEHDDERDQAVARLLAPLEQAVTAVVDIVDGVLFGKDSYQHASAAAVDWPVGEAIERFLHVVFGEQGAARMRAVLGEPGAVAALRAELDSPWGLPTNLDGNRFSWDATIHPVPRAAWSDGGEYVRAAVEFMRTDHLWAAHDNLTNPAKAAADGVWRDLRDVLAYAVDFGGLRAGSHREFLDVYMRHHNRLANGAALEVMEKVLALVEAGVVDLSVGPDARVGTEGDRFVVTGPHTGRELVVDVLVDARVHPFDVAADQSPVYPNLLRNGLVRKWTNPGVGEPDFQPGGLDLTATFHPVTEDGGVDRRLTFLGPPSEGVMFFQLGALRPDQNHHVMQDILCWMREFTTDLLADDEGTPR